MLVLIAVLTDTSLFVVWVGVGSFRLTYLACPLRVRTPAKSLGRLACVCGGSPIGDLAQILAVLSG